MARLSKGTSRIVEKRKAAGYTQEELAKLVGVYQQQLSEWERKVVLPGINYLKKLSEVLNCSIDDLV